MEPLKNRCPWCGDDPLYRAYHDEEWGVPVQDDRHFFELLTLEGAQAGLSWLTVLKKRENYRRAFDGFDMQKIARYGEPDTQRLLVDPGIIRNRLKIASTINNARQALKLVEEYGSLRRYFWQYVDNRPLQNTWATLAEVPPRTELSDRMSKDLKKRGFKFIGSTICYAFMQAAGLVNDHLVSCYRHEQLCQEWASKFPAQGE